MKLKTLIYGLAACMLIPAATSCEGEKDLIIIEGNLPIKTSALYMVGDATPTGWSIDNPTPLTATDDDPLVFTWEGNLFTGEVKLCLTTGSWDAAFIRPMTAGDEIGKGGVETTSFQMHAGDPDEKWKVTDAGVYNLRFDLRNWTMEARYLGGTEEPAPEPIITDALYLVGDATPVGWNIDSPFATEKTGDFTFVYEGELSKGELKGCTSTGSWDVSFIRPTSDHCSINKNGVADNAFVYTASPDHKWYVDDPGTYRLTFNLADWTMTAEFIKGASGDEKTPIETSTLFMIGDATPGGWSMDDASEFTASPDNKYIFSWEGELVYGTFKLCVERDGTFSCPFIRPASADVEVSADGVASPGFVYTTNPDDQWRVTDPGTYRLTFDLEKWTISAQKL